MTDHFETTERFLIVTEEGMDLVEGDKGLADALRQHGPEWMTVKAQLPGMNELEELDANHAMVGKDDLAKYYLTTYTGRTTGRMADIGWDV